MLDGFYELHTELIFRDRTQVQISKIAFRAAREAAAKCLDPPDRAFLRDNGSYERHRLFYEFHLTKEMDAHKDFSKIDSMLVEVVILQSFLCLEEASEFRNSFSVARSVAVLGWMIQERLQYILLQTGDRFYQELMELRYAYGINKDVWEKRLVGATAEAKAMMQISHYGKLRIYPANIIEDVARSIDFFVETPDGSGACVSVKTDVGGRTRFLLESTTGYERAWNRIERGSHSFREYANRDWRPILVLIGKPRGEDISLHQRADCIHQWVLALEHTINGHDSLVLTA